MTRRTRKGLTLIELLIVVVIIGILSTIAVPKYQTTKGKANTAGLKSDLRNLTVAQESYFYETQSYTNDTLVMNFRTSPAVALTIVSANGTGWSATATHAVASPMTCGVFYGSAAPPLAATTQEGEISCQ
ncbi:MAG TPA: prepilin-type N-terminal cleavage/methylation domain-containing protein [Gemmatimonadaceae bacterium]|nr:prepilin-type N-terminal cleavage/methylation domain-containing protein [Gemmatimonadaceae bacterium]